MIPSGYTCSAKIIFLLADSSELMAVRLISRPPEPKNVPRPKTLDSRHVYVTHVLRAQKRVVTHVLR